MLGRVAVVTRAKKSCRNVGRFRMFGRTHIEITHMKKLRGDSTMGIRDTIWCSNLLSPGLLFKNSKY